MMVSPRTTLAIMITALTLATIAAPPETHGDPYNTNRPQSPTKADIEKSAALYRQALSAYRTRKKPAEAVAIFKESAVLNPAMPTYYELGNALIDVKRYDEAIRAYEAALALDTVASKTHLIYYNMACAESLAKRIANALTNIEMALRNNYYHYAHLRSDADLANVRAAAKQTIDDLIARYDNRAHLSRLLVGRWEDAPMTAERANPSYRFNRDGTFSWAAGNRSMTERAVSKSGRWSVRDGVLTLIVQERVIREGGRIIASTEPHAMGERTLVDYREKTVRPARAETSAWPISHVTPDGGELSPAKGRPTVLINTVRYWKTGD
ncbi:MAG TPA: tetratricopeptide repeat protein [Spirochaetota bacterium]|nr:tetratricopeptide repeat protein [Spirochaetota bacterium]